MYFLMQTNPLSWNENISHTLVLLTWASRSNTVRYTLLSGKDWETNKKKADANRDFIWITRGFCPWNLAKAEPVSGLSGLSFTHCPVASTPKVILESLLSFSLLTLIPTAPSAYFNSARPFSSLLSCGRKFSQLPTKASLNRRRQ